MHARTHARTHAQRGVSVHKHVRSHELCDAESMHTPHAHRLAHASARDTQCHAQPRARAHTHTHIKCDIKCDPDIGSHANTCARHARVQYAPEGEALSRRTRPAPCPALRQAGRDASESGDTWGSVLRRRPADTLSFGPPRRPRPPRAGAPASAARPGLRPGHGRRGAHSATWARPCLLRLRRRYIDTPTARGNRSSPKFGAELSQSLLTAAAASPSRPVSEVQLYRGSLTGQLVRVRIKAGPVCCPDSSVFSGKRTFDAQGAPAVWISEAESLAAVCEHWST